MSAYSGLDPTIFFFFLKSFADSEDFGELPALPAHSRGAADEDGLSNSVTLTTGKHALNFAEQHVSWIATKALVSNNVLMRAVRPGCRCKWKRGSSTHVLVSPAASSHLTRHRHSGR